MAGDPRRSKRDVKLKQDQCFSYDEESIRFLANRVDLNKITGEYTWQLKQSASETVVQSEVPVVSGSAVASNSSVSRLASVTNCLSVLSSPHVLGNVSELASLVTPNSVECPGVSQVHREVPNTVVVPSPVVNKTQCTARRSSTRLDYLDFSFDSVSQTNSDFAGMVNTDSEEQVGGECECEEGNSCEKCSAAALEPETEPTNKELMSMMRRILAKTEGLDAEVRSSRQDINSMKARLQSLEGSRAGSLRLQDSQAESSQGEVEFSLGEEVVQAQKDKLSKVKASKDKKGRILDERSRGLRVIKDKLRERERLDSFSQVEDEETAGSSIFDLSDVRKKMSKTQKKACDKTMSGRIREAGAVFPAEESSSSGSSYSGTEDSDSDRSRRRRRSRRKVKSGAKLVRRSVKHTELWPHTVANEEQGEELTCDTIGLPQFLSCFSAIMISCDSKSEKAGRASLLNAFSSVYECLPWVEARTFHNLIMVKLEQERIDWKTDFSVLAERFLNHKVRLSLKSKGSAAGLSSSSRSGRGNFPRRQGSYGFRQGNYSAGRGKSLQVPICKLWNSGACSFGDSCKYKHVCMTCAEAGKPSEMHKASSHKGKQQG